MWEKSVSIKSKGKKKQKDAKEVEVDYVKLLNDVKSKLLSYEDLLAKKDQFKKEEVSQAKLLERCKKELIEVQKQRSHLESLLRAYEEKEFSIK